MNNAHRRHIAGYSMAEQMVVLAIIVLMASVALPNIHGYRQEAALLGPSEWTDERKKKLKELWHTDKRVEQIRLELGITYTNRSVSRQAAVLGLPPRCEQPKRKHAHREKSCSRISVLATATREARLYRHETLISFPESATLEMAWRHELAKVRQERGAVQQ